MTTQQFKNAIVTAMAAKNVPVYHIIAAPEAVSPILCWQELGGKTQHGNDKPVVRIQRMQLDYFSTTEYDENYKYIESIMSGMDCGCFHEGKTFDNDRQEWRDIWTVKFLEAL